MSLLENLTLPAVCALWLVVGFRLRGLARGGSRPLAVMLLLLACMFSLKLTFVGEFVDAATGIVGLQTIVRDSLAVSLFAIALHAVAALTRARPSPRWSVVLTAAVVAVAGLLMGLFFAAAEPAHAGIVSLGPESSELPALGFWLAYLVPYGASLVCIAWITLRDVSRPGPWTRGRRGLVLFGAAALAGLVYVAVKITVVSGAASVPFLLEHAAVLQGVPSLVAVSLLVAGAATWTDPQVGHRYLLLRLLPAHRALTRDQRLPRLPASGLSVTERLDRRVVEIAEAVVRHQQDARSTVTYVPDAPPATEPVALVRQLGTARRAATAHQRARIARLVTEVLAPPNLAVLVLLLLGLREGALGWAAVGALFVAVLPYLVVIVGVRRGVWRDRMLTTRRERIVPIISNVSFAVVGFGILAASPAPAPLTAFLGAAIATQVVLFAVTLFWKISFHSGVAAGILVILALELGWPVAAVLSPLVVVIAWSRVVLREHTVAQVVWGAPVGAVLLGSTYTGALAVLAAL